MRTFRGLIIVLCIVICLTLFGCNLPASTPTTDLSGTMVASTLGALQTSVALTQTREAVPDTPTFALAVTLPPLGTTSTALPGQKPVVKTDTLCWAGPGNQYEVISAVFTGTHVDLIGRGTISGWYIIRNPVYRDPCWILASALEIPIGTDLAGLPYFNPPPSPTPTPTKTPVPTDTP